MRLYRAAVAIGGDPDPYFKLPEFGYRSQARIARPLRARPDPEGRKVLQDDVLEFCDQFSPFDAEGFTKVRLGGAHDGGYVFIDDFADVSTVISCGISNDVSCDLAFADLGMKVLQFDHTVDGPPVSQPKFEFHKQAIDELQRIPGSRRLSDVIRNAGNPEASDLLLKIDIEGSEWSTFANVPADDLRRVRQIACEFHSSSRLSDPAEYSLRRAAAAVIRRNFFPVHIHANNFVGFVNVMGVPMPEVFEVTFVNKDFYRSGRRQAARPLQVDAPNDADAPDMFLGSPFSLGTG